MGDKIAVIVPIYNVEEYLRRSLDTVIAQSYLNLEILLINDGSLDNSGAICDEYAAADSRIRVFHIANGGVAKARQMGVVNSTSEYVVFVDPDDWLPLDSVERLYGVMTKDVDVVIGGFTQSSGRVEQRFVAKCAERLSQEEYVRALLHYEIKWTPWGKIFRRSLFGEDSFPSMSKGQDLMMTMEVMPRVRSVKVIDHSSYFYFVRDSSTMSNHKSTYDFERDICSYVYAIFRGAGMFDRHYDDLMYFSMNRVYKIITDSGELLSMSDSWIRDIYESVAKQRLDLKHRVMLLALRFGLLQRLIYWGRRLYRALR